MAEVQDVQRLQAEEDRARARETTFFRWLPHSLLLTVSTVVLLAGLSRIGGPPLLCLVLATAAWEAVWSSVRVRRDTEASGGLGRVGRMGSVADGVYLVGLFALTAALDLAHPLYGFFTWFLFIRLFDVARGRARWVGVVAVATLISWTQTGSPVELSGGVLLVWAALLLMNGGIAIAVVRFLEVSERHGEQRREAVAALEASNEQLQQALAENAGLHAQLLVQAHEAGVQAERERFAGEVHDTIAQGLAGIVTQLEALERATSPEERCRRLAEAKQIARRSLTEARRSLDAVGPERLEHSRLPDALRELATSWSAESGVAAQVQVTGTPRTLLADVEIALYRAVQEALTNVAKHAGAARTVVTLTYTDTEIMLDVRDDGRGSDAAARSSGGGFGLRSMRQRAATSGGHVTVESEPGVGTTVSVVIPTTPATSTSTSTSTSARASTSASTSASAVASASKMPPRSPIEESA